MASTYLSRTPARAGNRRTFTYSTWLKLSTASVNQTFICTGSSGTSLFQIYIGSTGRIGINDYDAGGDFYNISWSTPGDYVFRDASAWYHFVIAVDTTQASASNRIKFYINGEDVTSNFTQTTTPAQNTELNINNTTVHRIGQDNEGSTYWNGSMAHIHFIDGTAYDASAFGETDATSGIWKPILSPSVTYGTNGFFLKFGNSASLGTDSSGNANNFTLSGSGTQTLDTPSNVFATINGVNQGPYFAGTLSNGNLTHTGITAGNYYTPGSTLRASSGKYYAEFKCQDVTDWCYAGVDTRNLTASNDWIGKTTSGWSYLGGSSSGGSTSLQHNSLTSAYGDSYTTNDIIGIALDLDNNYLYFAKNGVWQNSGDPTSGATGTGGIDISSVSGNDFYFGASNWSGSYTGGWYYNFGNGYFGTTAVSTPESDSAGIGKFEYSVPSGYYALCTKNIATYG